MAKDVSLIRIKADTNDYERSIRQAQKTWDSFTKGIGLNMSKFTGVGAAIGAVSAALKVAKDAFFQNEQMLDEWGRAVKSSQSLYSGFLNALNNGNISGYLQNMSNIVSAARAAYDTLDDLNTFNAFNQINQEKARTNLTDAIAEFREGSGSKENVQAAADALKNELSKRQEKEYNAYVKAIEDAAQKRGISGAVLQRILEGSDEQYQQYKNLGLTGTANWYMGGGGPATAANEQEKIGEALRQLNDTELKDLQALGAQAQRTATEIAQVDKTLARTLKGGTGSSSGTGGKSGTKTAKEEYIPLAGSIDAQIAKVKELQDAFNQAAEQGVRNGLLKQLKEAEGVLNLMKAEAPGEMFRGGSSYEFSSMTDLSNLKITDEDLEKLDKIVNAGKAAETSWDSAMGAVSGLGSALAAIEDPAVKVLGIIAEAIATVALSFAKALSKDTKLGVFGWIAAAAAGTAAMVSTISAIKSATAGSYEQGGIVPGNNHNDGLIANVSSGELILNAAQQNNVASLLRNQGQQNMHLTATIKGTDIQLALNNTSRQQGRGTYVTAR